METADDASFIPIWRHDMGPRVEGDAVSVVDKKGRVVARVGEWVRMVGGEVSLEGIEAVDERTAHKVQKRCPGGYWLVGTEVWIPKGEQTG